MGFVQTDAAIRILMPLKPLIHGVRCQCQIWLVFSVAAVRAITRSFVPNAVNSLLEPFKPIFYPRVFRSCLASIERLGPLAFVKPLFQRSCTLADWIIIGTSLFGLISGPGASPATGPRSPASETTIEDPCHGAKRVEGIRSENDDSLHTCFCNPIRGIDGRLVRVEIRCW